MEHMANGQQRIFVVLADQADLSGAAAFSHKERKRGVMCVMRCEQSQAN